MLEPVVELSSYEDLVVATDGHPVVLYQLDPARLRRAWGFGRGPTAAWLDDTPHWGRTVTAIGRPHEAAMLVAGALAAEPHIDRVIMPKGTVTWASFPIGDGDDWDWFWTTEPPQRRPGEVHVTALDPEDAAVTAEVTALLDAAAPSASVRPDGSAAVRWLGVRAGDGGGTDRRLVACAARREQVRGVVSLSSITTHPDRRGLGLASDLTAAVTRRELAAGARAVTLGMYVDNVVARRVYEKLGFEVGQAFSSHAVL